MTNLVWNLNTNVDPTLYHRSSIDDVEWGVVGDDVDGDHQFVLQLNR